MVERLRGLSVAINAAGRPGALTLSENFLDRAPVGMLVTLADGRILWANEAMTALTGRTPRELEGQLVQAFCEPAGAELIAAESRQLIAGEAHLPARELRWRNASGELGWVSAQASLAVDMTGLPLLYGEPEQPCLIRQLLDITERRETEARVSRLHAELQARNAELERSNEELAQFAHVASHDLSEPLRVISGHVELLSAKYSGQLDETAQSWIAFAVDGCARMRTLIDDLLRYSRAGRELRYTTVDVPRLLDRVEAELQTAIREADAQLVVDGSLPVVVADESGLGQIFANLISNAVKYRRDDARTVIRVQAVRDSDGWVFKVADNGIGIPAHQRDRVFRIFQRLHGRSIPGTGIGLAICQKVVDQHGGTISATDATGGGTVFSFTIPDRPRTAS